MFSKTNLFLFLIAIIVCFAGQYAYAQPQFDQSNNYINNNGNLVPYILSQNSTHITIQGKIGSYVFNKNSCTMSIYNSTNTNNSPVIQDDNYQVLANLNGTVPWFPVSVINNASCSTTLYTNGDDITISATKSVPNSGIFQINYTKHAGADLKLSFKAVNQNPSWTNYHVGLSESFKVPRYIMLGNQTYDLSKFNNTILSRNWISNNKGDFFKITNNMHYFFGIGFNHINDIKINYINNIAIITLDYTYNTPILQPNHQIIIDPSVTLDNSGQFNSGSGATVSIAGFTIANHPNRILIAHVFSFNTITGVTYGSTPLTLLDTNLSLYQGYNVYEYYLNNPPVGSDTLTVNVSTASGPTGLIGYSYYYTGGIGNTGKYGGGGPSSSPQHATVTTTKLNSKLVSNWVLIYSTGTPSATPTAPLTGEFYSDSGHTFGFADQDATSITSYNTEWSFGGISNPSPSIMSFELKTAPLPSTPTISKMNTLNSTAINAIWNKPTGTAWFWANFTLSGGATTHINTTASTLTLNNFTAGSKYTLSVIAVNATGKSSSSLTKYNYTTNIAPTALSANLLDHITMASINWTNPTGNFSGFKIELQPKGSSWSTIISNTLNATNHYILTALTPAKSYGVRISTNYATGSNYSGVSTPSSILNFTAYQKSNGTVNTSINQVGNVVNINSIVRISSGYPSIIVKTITIKNFSTILLNASKNQAISTGSNFNFTNLLNATLSTTTQSNLTVSARITNSSGGIITIGPTNFILAKGTYGPSSGGKVDYNNLPVNYTINRTPSFTGLNVTVIRDVSLIPWTLNIKLSSGSGGPLSTQNSTWHNYTQNWYVKAGYSVNAPTTYYIDAYNPNTLVFSATSYGQGNLTATNAIQIFQGYLGNFFGLPLAIAIILCVAGLFTAKNSDTGIIFVLVTIGILGTAGMGLISIGQTQWGVALFIGVIGILMGTRFRG